MPSELKKPEPVAWSIGIVWHPNSRAHSEQTIKLTRNEQEQFGFDEPLYTAAQLEQYAADRVRGALERAAQECDRLTHALDNAGTSYHRPATADRCARAIRTLKEQTK